MQRFPVGGERECLLGPLGNNLLACYLSVTAELVRDATDHAWRKDEARACPALLPYQAELRAEMARVEPLTAFAETLVRALDDDAGRGWLD